MAANSSAVRRAGTRPALRPAKETPSFGVVDRRNVLERAMRRQSRVLLLLSGGVLAGALTVAAAGHALLAASQVRADNLQSSVASAVATQQNLELQRAKLETPSRVLSLAQKRFKMVAPSGITYLQPVDPGESVEQAHEAQAKATHSQRSGDVRSH